MPSINALDKPKLENPKSSDEPIVSERPKYTLKPSMSDAIATVLSDKHDQSSSSVTLKLMRWSLLSKIISQSNAYVSLQSFYTNKSFLKRPWWDVVDDIMLEYMSLIHRGVSKIAIKEFYATVSTNRMLGHVSELSSSVQTIALFEVLSHCGFSCDPNCVLVLPTTKGDTVQLVALRSIEANEKLTIRYDFAVKMFSKNLNHEVNMEWDPWGWTATEASKLNFDIPFEKRYNTKFRKLSQSKTVDHSKIRKSKQYNYTRDVIYSQYAFVCKCDACSQKCGFCLKQIDENIKVVKCKCKGMIYCSALCEESGKFYHCQSNIHNAGS